MKGAGGAMTALGIVLVLIAVVYQPTVSTDASFIGGVYEAPREVYNLGALQLRELMFNGGAALFVAGCVLFAIGDLRDSLIRAGTAKPSEDDIPAQPAAAAPCAWCGRRLTSPLRTCTSYGDGELRKLSVKVGDEVCKRELVSRGYPVSPQATESGA